MNEIQWQQWWDLVAAVGFTCYAPPPPPGKELLELQIVAVIEF